MNADTAAGAIATALNAKRLLLLTDVAGVLDKDKELIHELTLPEIPALDRRRHHHRRHDPQGRELRERWSNRASRASSCSTGACRTACCSNSSRRMASARACRGRAYERASPISTRGSSISTTRSIRRAAGSSTRSTRRSAPSSRARLEVDAIEARRIQKSFYHEYGTTLRGLMERHQVEPLEFLDFVHDIDHSPVAADKILDEVLHRLPGRKLVFTNGTVRMPRRFSTVSASPIISATSSTSSIPTTFRSPRSSPIANSSDAPASRPSARRCSRTSPAISRRRMRSA